MILRSCTKVTVGTVQSRERSGVIDQYEIVVDHIDIETTTEKYRPVEIIMKG